MEIEVQLPGLQRETVTLSQSIIIADLDKLFADADVSFWLLNGFPSGKENQVCDGDVLIGLAAAQLQERGRPYDWGVDDFPFLQDLNGEVSTSVDAAESDREKPKMILLSPGSFLMGVGPAENPIPPSSGFYSDDAMPARKVQLHHVFEIGQLPITRKQYQTITGQVDPVRMFGLRSVNSPMCPQVSINWYEAIVFCNLLSQSEGLPCAYVLDADDQEIEEWGDPSDMDFDELVEMFSECGVCWLDREHNTGYRLPTEAEWEYACRAGNLSTRYNDNVNQIAWHRDNSERQLQEVGLLAPNDWGLYDMLGNVFEWCWDWYDAEYYKERGELDINPYGPDSGTYKVVRGGDFESNRVVVRASFRGEIPEYRGFPTVGFRVVRTILMDT